MPLDYDFLNFLNREPIEECLATILKKQNSGKTEENIIKGCQSKVWVHAEMKDDKVFFTADSDAIITKGIIAILIRVFSGQHPKDIIQADTSFIDEIGLKEHLSPTRANGLVSMIKQIKMYAIAYQTQLN